MNQNNQKFTEGLLNIPAILKALGIKKGQTILDAGCGTGYMSKIFSDTLSQSGKVYALDTDKYFIEKLINQTKGKTIEAGEHFYMQLFQHKR